MGIEIQILDWMQNIRTPFGDIIVPLISGLGNAGIIWIALTLVLLVIPKTRRSGLIMALALIADIILCNGILKNLVARTRPYDVNTAVNLLIEKPVDYSFPSGHTAASFAAVTALYLAGEKKLWKPAVSSFDFNCFYKNVSVCTLSYRYSGRNSRRYYFRLYRVLYCR